MLSRMIGLGCACVGMIAVTLGLGSCGDDGSQTADQVVLDRSTSDATVDSLAELLKCASTREISEMSAPIRGQALAAGSACEFEAGLLHVFATDPTSTVTVASSRRVELFGGNVGVGERCPDRLVVGESFVIAAPSPDVAESVRAVLGGLVVEVDDQLYPPSSYGLPSGCGDGLVYADENGGT